MKPQEDSPKSDSHLFVNLQCTIVDIDAKVDNNEVRWDRSNKS